MFRKFLDPKNDVAFKNVFGIEKNKGILIHFINDILELKGDERIESVEYLSPIQDPEIAYNKQSIIDVLCRDVRGVQIIVEMQVAPTKGFEKRAQYYAAKAYSRQLKQGSEEKGRYENLKEVIFIAIADCVIFKNKKNYKSDHVVLDKETHEHDLKDFSFTFIELPKFNKTEIKELKNIVEKWCYFFKYATTTNSEELEKLIGSDLVIKKAYDALDKFNWNEKQLLAYEKELKRIMDNQAADDYIFDQGKEEGKKEGRKEGKKEGRKEGMEKGKKEGMEKGKKAEKLETARKMLSKNYPIDSIVDVTGLAIDEIKTIKKQKKSK